MSPPTSIYTPIHLHIHVNIKSNILILNLIVIKFNAGLICVFIILGWRGILCFSFAGVGGVLLNGVRSRRRLLRFGLRWSIFLRQLLFILLFLILLRSHFWLYFKRYILNLFIYNLAQVAVVLDQLLKLRNGRWLSAVAQLPLQRLVDFDSLGWRRCFRPLSWILHLYLRWWWLFHSVFKNKNEFQIMF